MFTQRPITDKAYYPFSTGISIHDNIYERNAGPATVDKNGQPLTERRICIRNNKNQSLINLDAGRGFKNMSRDAAPFDCQLPPLKATAINAR